MTLNEMDAYLATFEFLVLLYERTRSDDLGGILGSMSLLEDGMTADPSMWQDWIECVNKVKQGNVDASLRISPREN
jgi:hypothetical protein